MSLRSLYSSEMRRQLQVFPVWQPGDPVEIGDIGTLNDGVFEKQTSLKKHFPDIEFAPVESELDHPYRFRSKDCVVASVGASAGFPGGTTAVEAKVQFGAHGGVVFDAAGLQRMAIDDLLDVRTKVRSRRTVWPRGMVLVTAVDSCKKFHLLISDAGNASASLRGSVDAIAGLSIADPSVKIGIDSDAGYQTEGSGPVAATVYGFGWLGYLMKKFQLLEEEPEEPAPDFGVLAAADFPGG
jgi:hypothetical protein